MRKFINIVEAKMVDGFISGPSYSELKSLAGKNDLRGVAYDGKVYLAPAMEWVHSMMRNSLGIPPLYASRDAEPAGFDFYVGTEAFGMDEADDRFDWFGFKGTEHFVDDELVLNVTTTPEEAVNNPQFRRMIGPMTRPS
jgi:hypothetical protein